MHPEQGTLPPAGVVGPLFSEDLKYLQHTVRRMKKQDKNGP